MTLEKCNSCSEFKQVKETLREIKADISQQEKRLQDLESDKRLKNFQYDEIIRSLNELKVDLSDLKQKPAKNWNVVITAIITAIVTAVVSKGI